jgi:integrase
VEDRITYVGLDVHKEGIVVAVAEGGVRGEVLHDRDERPFCSPEPGQSLREVKKFWSSVVRQARILQYRRHDNRHTYASHLVSSGLSLEIVGQLLGHTTPTTTKPYARLADDPLRAATDRFGSKRASWLTASNNVRLARFLA